MAVGRIGAGKGNDSCFLFARKAGRLSWTRSVEERAPGPSIGIALPNIPHRFQPAAKLGTNGRIARALVDREQDAGPQQRARVMRSLV